MGPWRGQIFRFSRKSSKLFIFNNFKVDILFFHFYSVHKVVCLFFLLAEWHVSSLTRDQTRTPYSGSVES